MGSQTNLPYLLMMLFLSHRYQRRMAATLLCISTMWKRNHELPQLPSRLSVGASSQPSFSPPRELPRKLCPINIHGIWEIFPEDLLFHFFLNRSLNWCIASNKANSQINDSLTSEKILSGRKRTRSMLPPGAGHPKISQMAYRLLFN